LPVVGSAAVLGVWGAAAHDAGAGWTQAIGALVTGVLVVGMLAPALAVARCRCQVLTAPVDAAAGAALDLEVTSTAPIEVRPLDPPGPTVMVSANRPTLLEVRPQHRGELDRVTVAVASAAPFGILWWTRRETLVLPRPVSLAPRVGRDQVSSRSAGGKDEPDQALGTRAGRAGAPRGVRPYEPGDRRARVHWRQTAHSGALMVSEPEPPVRHVAAVDGLLPADRDAAERRAELVMATVRELLGAGVDVELRTEEPGGEVVAPVPTMRAAGRRLARALPQTGAPWGERLGDATAIAATRAQDPTARTQAARA
jgi:uncharacterized protein (DUF58 family)